MEQPIQGAKLVAILSEKFNKDAVWTLTAANALAGATTGEREVIFASSQDRQLLLLDGLVRTSHAIGALHRRGGSTGAPDAEHGRDQQGADMATQRQVARDEALAVLEAQTAPRKPKCFSSVGNMEAFRFLGDLNVLEVDGNAVFEEELQLPDGTPTCIGFDMSGYANEDPATGPLLAHHKEQLELLGVRFGRAAFDIYDVHSLTNDSLLIQHGSKAFRGIFDGCIAPYGLSLTSSLSQCRIVYEHRMPGALYARKGQAILKLLAACAYGPCPVLLDLTDGMKHTVYTIRGLELIAWTELTPTQAYNLQARHLMSDSSRTARALTLEQIPEEEQAWMRPLHQLRPESRLREQLESVIPFLPPDERMPAALELIHAGAQAQQPAQPMQLPASIRAFYARRGMVACPGLVLLWHRCGACEEERRAAAGSSSSKRTQPQRPPCLLVQTRTQR